MSEATITRLTCRQCGGDHFEGSRSASYKSCVMCGARIRVPVVKLAADFVITCNAGGKWAVECPYCKGTDTHVTTTLRPVRYHRCDNATCRANFKSVEK